MGTAERKAREKNKREKLILDTAYRLLVTDGYLGLTVDKIADEIEYSKGTVYQHFKSKEEMVVALANRLQRTCSDNIRQALMYEGCARERLYAGVMMFMKMYTEHPELAVFESISMEPSIWSKASEEGRREHNEQVESHFYQAEPLVREAVQRGELVLGAWYVSEILMALWSMVFGNRLLTFQLSQSHSEAKWLPVDYFNYTKRIVNVFLDGLCWQPLFAENQYGDVEQWVMQNLKIT